MFGPKDCSQDYYANGHGHHHQDDCEYECYHSGVLPFGTSVNAILGAQVAKGDAAQMVLHHYDFVPGEAALTCRGTMQLEKIAGWLPKNPFPVVVEAVPCNPELSDARRKTVLDALAQRPFPVPAERVIVGPSPAPGLDAVAADAANLREEQILRSGGGIGAGGPPPGFGPPPGGNGNGYGMGGGTGFPGF
jgi:hypothetical protein